MNNKLAILVLNIFGIIIIIKWFRILIKDYKDTNRKSSFFAFSRFKHFLMALAFLMIPILLVNQTDIELIRWKSIADLNAEKYVFAIVLSFFISFLWFNFIIKLDIFDKEKNRYLFLIIGLALFFTALTDLPYNLIHKLGFVDSLTPVNSFIYSVFGIGLIEETIKLIPLLIILKYTKAIDEPYDYILYASIAALSFSFLENSMYLHNYGLQIINARALLATVAHMVFSSTIAYGFMTNKYHLSRYNPKLVLVFFFLISIFSHGFYDFWLINQIASQYSWITTLFFLLGVHIWFVMINNSINISNYYTENKRINNDKLKLFLIMGLLSLFMFSYLYIAFTHNSIVANRFFRESVLVYGYIIFYLIATLTQFDLVQGVIKPLRFSFKSLLPKIRKKQ